MHHFIFIQVEVHPLWSGALMDTLQRPVITNNLESVVLRCVSGTESEIIWDDLVATHHYLGYKKLLGHRLKYLAFLHGRPVAALSWSAPALTLKLRDQFIGWDAQTRKEHLSRLAANSRFVIFPWVNMANLGSYVLGQNLNRIREDWKKAFQQDLWQIHTIVKQEVHDMFHETTTLPPSSHGKGLLKTLCVYPFDISRHLSYTQDT
jgi:hypothetical protein